YDAAPLESAGAARLDQIKKLERMLETRRANAAHFVKLFAADSRFIIQRENGRSSWLSFTVVLHPQLKIDRRRVMDALRRAGIEFRMITGGCFPMHAAIKYFDYE